MAGLVRSPEFLRKLHRELKRREPEHDPYLPRAVAVGRLFACRFDGSAICADLARFRSPALSEPSVSHQIRYLAILWAEAVGGHLAGGIR